MLPNGLNIDFPIYYDVDGVRTPFHNLTLRKAVVDSVVMSLSDKITGDVVYNGSDLEFTMKEYIIYNDVKYSLVSPPTIVREGLVKDNSDLKGATRYSFEFYHPMYMLSNFPFTDVAVSIDEMRYKSQDKVFGWIGKPADYVAKLNKNLENTEFVVVLSESVEQGVRDTLSDVLSFSDATIADALKTGYDTWGLPYVVDKLNEGEYSYTTAQYPNGRDYYDDGKRFVIIVGLPANEIYNTDLDQQTGTPFVFRFGQGVGLKNNSRTPRNNKIVTRIAGYGSERNIPYGYPQIRWYGDPNATCTIGNSVGPKQNQTINGTTYAWVMSYPIYDGIVGGEWVKLIKHPFTRKHLMPTVYAEGVFNKVSQFLPNGSANPNFNPDLEIVDYYDAVEGDEEYPYKNTINLEAPSYEIKEFEDIHPELGEAQILGATPVNADLTDADTWDDTMDDDGNYLQSYFKIQLPQLTFDIYACAAITEEMQINMRSGACIGCTFTVQVDWEDYKRNFYDSEGNFDPEPHTTADDGHVRDITKYPDSSNGPISVVVQKDINTFGTLMPNIYQYPKGQIVENGVITYAGDAFVVLGVSLPLSYITSAQTRLDAAMKGYMFGNNIHYFDYPLKFDEFFLTTRTHILNQIRPNTIIRFDFNDEELSLFVKQLTIKYNEGVLPQYDITLTDNVEVVLNKIGQVADDVEKLGALIAAMRQSVGGNVAYELARKLSKVYDDAASGHITFTKGATFSDIGFLSGFLGHGARIDKDGNGEFERVDVRGSLHAAELVFNLIDAEEGEAIRSIGHGEIESVSITSPTSGTATLKLDGNQWATIDVGDICRGMYNTIGKGYDNENISPTDANGFQNKQGFFASYFKVTSVTKAKGSCSFTYELQTTNGTAACEHPCPLMKFAVYGNFDNTKKERQSSTYISTSGIAPRELYLAGVNDWKIKPENIKIASGNIEGLMAWEEVTEAEYNEVSDPASKRTWDEEVTTGGTTEIIHHYAILKTLHGDAGFYCEDNIYLGGIINQFKSAAMDAIASQITNIGQAQVRCNYDSYPVDCDKDGKILPPSSIIDISASLWLGGATRLNITSVTATWNGETISGQITDNTWEYNLELIAGQVLTSGVVSIVMTGTDNENNPHTASKTISIIANRQGQQGNAGTSASRLDVTPESIVIDCNEFGIIKSGNNAATISGKLFVGTRQVVPTSYSITWNGTSDNYSPIGKEGTTETSVDSSGTVSRTFAFVANDVKALSSTYVTISVVGGNTTITKIIPVIANWQGASGNNGQDAVTIKTNIDSIIVDCSFDGVISNSTSPTISASLYIGSRKVTTLTTKTMTWASGAGNTYTPTISFVSDTNGTMSRQVSFAQGGSTLASSSILISMSNLNVAATKTIPVFANRQGDEGDNGIGYTAQLSRASDSIVVDAIGQIVGGLGNASAGWRLKTEVMIWDSVNERQLTCNKSATSVSALTDGQFMMSVVPSGCSTSVSDSGVVAITSITNTTSAGTITDFDAMRAMNGCQVEITATTYDGVATKFVFPITITHLDQTYITFDLTNEYDSMSYSSQTKRYVGLPIDTYIKAYANGDELADITEVHVSDNNTLMPYSVVAQPTFPDGERQEQIVRVPLSTNGTASGLRLLVSSSGLVRIDHVNNTSAEVDIADAKHTFNIHCKAKYAGVVYTSPTYQFVVEENTDTTLYKLIPSASAISEEDGIYSPSAISVNVSKTDNNGTTIVSESELEGSGNIKVRYASSALTTWTNTTLQNLGNACPQNFAQVDKAITIFLLDVSNNAAIRVLDVETITINKGGKDGAGQAYIESIPDQFVIDCDNTGKPLSQRGVTLFGSLMWGNYRCDIASVSNSQMTYTTSSGSTPTMGNALWDEEGKRIKRTFTFTTTRVYNSGYATITLTGTDEKGDEHTATKTVPFYINRRGVGGGTGEAGRGIVSVVTYYKAFPVGSNVTPPATDVDDPTTQGWSATYIDATEENPYLWRFTRTTYTKEPLVEQTNAELIYVWSNTTNPNLLADTEFITGQMSMWNKMGNVSDNTTGYTTTQNSTQYDGHNAFGVWWGNSEDPNPSESGYIRFLEQRLYEKLRAGSWYTVSFWLKGEKGDEQSTKLFRLPLELSQLADITNGVVYMDGQSRGTLTYLQYEPTTSWVKHTATFKAKELDANASIIWDMFTTFYSQNILIAMPKLEVGRIATPYEAIRPVIEPITRTSTWEDGKQYYQGAAGEPFLDIVRCNNQWNKCKLSHISNESNKPVQDTRTAFWDVTNNLSFIATDLLLADQAVIRLVQSQKILMTNDKNQLTASLNYDGDGGYCIYYPASGNKMMEFSSDGYIKYYRDEAGDNSLEWKLGLGGSIIGHNSDDWKPIMLYKLQSNAVNFTKDTTFERTTYYKFVDGDLHNYAAYDGAIYSGHTNNDPTDLTANSAALTGWYTPNVSPWQALIEGSDNPAYAITMYRIVRSTTNPKIAKITQTWTRYYDGESYTNEQDS